MKNNDLQIYEKIVEKGIVVYLIGDIHSPNINEFEKILSKYKIYNFAFIILNFEFVRFIDSIGISKIIKFAQDYNIIITKPQPQVQRLFKLVHIAKFIKIYNDLKTAIANNLSNKFFSRKGKVSSLNKDFHLEALSHDQYELKSDDGTQLNIFPKKDILDIIIELEGIADSSNINNLISTVNIVIETDFQNLIFDINKLNFIDSKAIAYFLKLNLTLQRKNKKIIFKNPNEKIKKIFNISKIDKVVQIID